MIIVMKPNAKEESVKNVLGLIESCGLDSHLSCGKEVTIIGVIGDKSKLRNSNIEIAEGVEKIVEVTESYKLSNRKFHPESSVIQVGNTRIGGDEIVIMSGPCAVESEEQVMETAKAIKKAGAQILRGGAYKPRTSPYSFQGLEEDGLKLMREARNERVSYIGVIGEREAEAGTLTVRSSKVGELGEMSVEDFTAKLLEEIRTKAM